MSTSDWISVITCILLFGIGFLLGENHGQRRGSRSVALVAGESWDKCDQASMVIHADGHGSKMITCWKDVTVSLKDIK